MATNIFRKSRPALGRLALYLLIFVGAALALNAWIFTGPAIQWSRTLENPDWSPAGGVIGAVWVGLFTLMALAAFTVDRFGDAANKDFARLAIIAQYLVCMGWTFGYFALQSVANGFYITIVALVLSVPVTLAAFRASRLAGVLMVPLVLWLIFALALSWSTWRLNA
ncbi:TspO/MBR family protein [Oceanicaulis sp. MMSF_3324]|uniref:TspO/MBR family protein n=1 Tax=Oceanicaulis sp. MMSF_3324 TaxID=3046702 RepID=UPI0027400597|nr:TspO/MBR family protein [Oceanicaulis sp. MMSF_3324]